VRRLGARRRALGGGSGPLAGSPAAPTRDGESRDLRRVCRRQDVPGVRGHGGASGRGHLGLEPRSPGCDRLCARVHGGVGDVVGRVLRRGGTDVKLRRLTIALTTLALLAPAAASAETFDPSDEFQLKEWVPIHIGGLDLSINRAVVYLLLGSALTCVLGIVTMRWRTSKSPTTRQTVGELLYDIAQTQVAE